LLVRQAEVRTAPWRSLIVPVEHGGWGFLAEPLVLGLALAPSAPGLVLALGVVLAFLVRHPLRLALLDRRRGARHARTALAEAVASSLAVLATGFFVAAAGLARGPLWPALLLAAPPSLVALLADVRGTSREVVPVVAGALALAAAAPAVVLAGGGRLGVALGAWALLGLRAWTSIAYVRARLRLDRGRPAGVAAVLAAHAAAVLAAAALAAGLGTPRLAVVAFVLLFARAAHGLSRWRSSLRPQAVGVRELAWSAMAVVLFAVGFRAGL
jgi:hypothetical protein